MCRFQEFRPSFRLLRCLSFNNNWIVLISPLLFFIELQICQVLISPHKNGHHQILLKLVRSQWKLLFQKWGPHSKSTAFQKPSFPYWTFQWILSCQQQSNVFHLKMQQYIIISSKKSVISQDWNYPPISQERSKSVSAAIKT